MDRPKLLLATTNAGKRRELSEFLASTVEVVDLTDFPSLPAVAEDRDSFEGNAEKKALAYCRGSGYPTLADDSGICVDALGGAPGIFSARYAPGDDRARIEKLLTELKKVPAERRQATFVCALCLALPAGPAVSVVGTCRGTIASSPRGQNGFGYDPIFLLDDGRSMAELPDDEKAKMSHRADAYRQMEGYLRALGRGSGG